MEAQILETNNLCAEPPNKNDSSKYYQALNTVISSGGSKEFLGRAVGLKELDSMGPEELEAYHKIYELNYANKIGEGIVSSIIGAYSKFANKFLPIDNVEKLEEDLQSDYILNAELKNIVGKIAMAFGGKLMASLSLSVITFQHVRLPSKRITPAITETKTEPTTIPEKELDQEQ
jgi:hypothetical protein